MRHGDIGSTQALNKEIKLNYKLILRTLHAQRKQLEFDANVYARFGAVYPQAEKSARLKAQIVKEIEKVEAIMKGEK